MRVRVAAAQIPQSNNPDENYERIVEVVRKTEADVICFPETALTGESRPHIAETSPFHSRILSTAAGLKKWVIYGAYTRRGAGNVFNEAWVAGSDGLAAVYKKRHLWAGEDGVTPGTEAPPVIETPFGKIGVLICWDLAFPEEARSLAARGADIILCPAYWYAKYGTADVITDLPLVRAFENQVFTVLADACSKETVSASRIASPRCILSASGSAERVITAELDLEELDRSRALFDCWPKNGSGQ